MPKKRSETYGKNVFRRKRNGQTQIFARVGYYDQNGQWKYKYEKAVDEEDAIKKAKKIIELHQKHGSVIIDGSQLSFNEFADWYKAKYVVEPTYEQGQQVAGLRTYKNVKTQVERLKDHFGKKKVSKITADDLTTFKNKRKNLDKVKTATINRDLELLRTMFNKGVTNRLLTESPFVWSEGLIRKSLEARRKVTVTAAQEKEILEVTRAMENKYIYPLTLALRDTGARPSELYPYAAYDTKIDNLAEKIKFWTENEVTAEEKVYLPLCWFQLFQFEFAVVPLASLKARQIEYRFGTMTSRLRQALLDLWETTDKNPVQLVFPFKTITKEWAKVRKATKLPDLRIRDWRRIWTTNADMAGIPEKIAQRILGHKEMQTTFHYTEADLESVIRASKAMDDQMSGK